MFFDEFKYPWLTELLARRPFKVVAVALANKMARTAWALLAHGGTYRRLSLRQLHKRLGAEHDRDRGSRGLCSERSGSNRGCDDYRHPTTDQVGHDRRYALELTVQPVVLDQDVLTLDVAEFPETRAERGQRTRGETIERCLIKEPPPENLWAISPWRIQPWFGFCICCC